MELAWEKPLALEDTMVIATEKSPSRWSAESGEQRPEPPRRNIQGMVERRELRKGAPPTSRRPPPQALPDSPISDPSTITPGTITGYRRKIETDMAIRAKHHEYPHFRLFRRPMARRPKTSELRATRGKSHE
jgi:hypothetical protein